MSTRFKLVLFVRFLGYLLFFSGVVGFVAIFGPLVSAESRYRTDQILGIRRIVPNIITSNQDGSATSSFGDVVTAGFTITPQDTQFGIVIEKINANARVVANVDPGNEGAYIQALSKGVAHAAGTNLPGERGNIYLFSHSTDAPWNIIRYNAVFYLLRELESGDRVIIFYQDRRYDYIVFDKQVVEPSDITFLTNRYDSSVLTLQTCDPPGTLFKRLVVRARLAGIVNRN